VFSRFSRYFSIALRLYELTLFQVTTSCMSFVADLRDVIHGFHFADRRLSQLPSSQAASSSSHNHRAGQRCFCLHQRLSNSNLGRSQARRLKGRKKLVIHRALSSGRGSMKMLPWTLISVRNGRLWNVTSYVPQV